MQICKVSVPLNVVVVVMMVLVFPVTGEERDDRCIETMSSCQAEREKLSYASQTNITAELCSALQLYSDCMGPKVHECPGVAKKAFSVIINMYVREPYKCQLRNNLLTETVGDNTNKHDSNAIIPSAHGPDSRGLDEDGDSNSEQPYALDVLEPIQKHPDTTKENIDEAAAAQTSSTTASHPRPTKKPFDPSGNNRSSTVRMPVWLTVVFMLVYFFSLFIYC